MTASAITLWNSQVSSPTGWMNLSGRRKPYRPVSRSSVEKEKVELATPRAQSEAPPLATYRMHGMQPILVKPK